MIAELTVLAPDDAIAIADDEIRASDSARIAMLQRAPRLIFHAAAYHSQLFASSAEGDEA